MEHVGASTAAKRVFQCLKLVCFISYIGWHLMSPVTCHFMHVYVTSFLLKCQSSCTLRCGTEHCREPLAPSVSSVYFQLSSCCSLLASLLSCWLSTACHSFLRCSLHSLRRARLIKSFPIGTAVGDWWPGTITIISIVLILQVFSSGTTIKAGLVAYWWTATIFVTFRVRILTLFGWQKKAQQH